MRPIPKEDPPCRNLPPSHTTIVEYLELFKVAPHVNTCVKSDLTSDHPILNRAIKGDFFRFMKNVGGGGGHSLTIKNFLTSVSIVYKSKQLYTKVHSKNCIITAL